jgi:hypothetical protein
MALVMLDLFERPERWIHRRVERIYYKDFLSAHHQVSVDFTLPAGMPPVSRFDGHDVHIAPLFLLRKSATRPLYTGRRPRRRFVAFGKRRSVYDMRDSEWLVARRHLGRWTSRLRRAIPSAEYFNVGLCDQDGNRQPLISRQQSKLLATVMLWESAERVLDARLPPTLRNQIAAIANREWRYLAGPLRYVFHTRVSKGDPRAKLQASQAFRELAYTLASHYIVASVFTQSAPPRRIYKLSYEEATSAGGGKVRRWLGWKSEQFFVPLTEIGAAASYTVEVDFPDGVQGNAVGLVGMRYESFGRRLPQRRAEDSDYHIQQIDNVTKGTIYIPNTLPGRRVGASWVKLRAKRSGFLSHAFLGSLVITLVLLLATAVSSHIVDNNTPDAAMAVLLLLPAVLAAFIARPDEHAITARMLNAPRIALLANGLLLFLAAICLLSAEPPRSDSAAGTGSEEARAKTISVAISVIHSAIAWVQERIPACDYEIEAAYAILTAISAILLLYFTSLLVLPMPRGSTVYKPDEHVQQTDHPRRTEVEPERGGSLFLACVLFAWGWRLSRRPESSATDEEEPRSI